MGPAEARWSLVKEIQATRFVDGSSTNLLNASRAGKPVRAIIHFTKEDGSNYLTAILTLTLISGYSVSSGGSEGPRESLSLNFETIDLKYTVPSDVNAGAPVGP